MLLHVKQSDVLPQCRSNSDTSTKYRGSKQTSALVRPALSSLRNLRSLSMRTYGESKLAVHLGTCATVLRKQLIPADAVFDAGLSSHRNNMRILHLPARASGTTVLNTWHPANRNLDAQLSCSNLKV